jgi:hypothetical protein
VGPSIPPKSALPGPLGSHREQSEPRVFHVSGRNGEIGHDGDSGFDLPDDEAWAQFEAELNAEAIPPPGPRDWLPPPEPEEPFIPPEVPPIGGDSVSTLAWFGAVGSPILMIFIFVFWSDAPRFAIAVCAVAFLASLGVLLWRMPTERSDDDDGAVV